MTETNKTTKTDIYNIDPRRIVVVDGFNSRTDFGNIEELAAQIKEQGMLNPITVIPQKDDNGNETYRLVDGERRYRAVMLLLSRGVDIARIKALFLSKSTSEEEMLIQQFLRNEGKNFTEYELGVLCRKLRDNCGKTVAEIAKMLGKNQGVICYALADLEYDPRIQEMLKNNQICGPDVRRVFTAAKEKYGKDEYEQKALKELLRLEKAAKDKAQTDGNDKTNAPKVSTKDCLLVSNAKDTKAFIKGMGVFNRFLLSYSVDDDDNPIDLGITPKQAFDYLNTHRNEDIRAYFEKARQNAIQKKAV